MADETVSATTIINAPAEVIFAILSDQPSTPRSTGPAGSANRSTASH
jgi:hypothetical protein